MWQAFSRFHEMLSPHASRIAAMPLRNFYCPSEFFTPFSLCSSHTHWQPYFSTISTVPQLSLLSLLRWPSKFATMQLVEASYNKISQISPSQEVLKLCHVSYSTQHRHLSSWARMSQTPLPLSGGLCKHPPGLIGSHLREQ